MPRKIEISHRTIIFTVLFLMLLWFLYLVRDVILQVFVALLIAIILNPLVTKLSKYKVPRGISAIVIYLILIGILGVSLSGLVPAVIDQTTAFVGILPSYISNFQLPFGLNQTFAQELSAQLGKLPQQIGGFVVSIFSNTLTILSTLIVSLYLVIEWATLENELEHFFGESKANSLKRRIDSNVYSRSICVCGIASYWCSLCPAFSYPSGLSGAYSNAWTNCSCCSCSHRWF